MQDLVDSALGRIASAASLEDLEALRVEVLGRKGVLTQLSKDMGKLTTDEPRLLAQDLKYRPQQCERHE